MSTDILPTLSPTSIPHFQEVLTQTLFLWDALSIACSHDPRAAVPGAMSSLRANLAEAVWDEMSIRSGKSALDCAEVVESLLNDFMEQVFEVLVDDDSLAATADALVRRYGLVATGVDDKGELAGLRTRYEERLARDRENRMVAAVVREEDQDTDASEEESEDGEGDAMEGVQIAAPRQRMEKAAPEVDDEGFTMVSRKR